MRLVKLIGLLTLVLVLMAGCPSPAAPPSPPLELPTDLTLPRSVTIDISETLPPPISTAALKTIELGGEFSNEITTTSGAAQSGFDRIDAVLSRFNGLAIPASEAPNQTIVFPGGEAFIDLRNFDFYGTGITPECSGHSAEPPVCMRLWVRADDGFQRVLSAVFDFPPSLANKGKGELRILLDGAEDGCHAAVRYDFLNPEAFQSSETFFGCLVEDALGTEASHASVTYETLGDGWLKIANAAGYTETGDGPVAFEGTNMWEKDFQALLGIFNGELFCANLFTGAALDLGHPQCSAIAADTNPEGIEPVRLPLPADILTFDFPSIPPFLCNDAPLDDGDVCTVDACDPESGGVSHVAVGNDDGNVCTEDSCDPITGVHHTPVSIDDGSVCTVDSCAPETGDVSHAPVAVDDGNACTLDSCHPVAGVRHTPVAVDDADACTIDTCYPATGIVDHTPVDTDDGNACTADSCDASNGEIAHEPADVDDQNPCTADSCDPSTGNVSHILLDADQDGLCDALDPCPQDPTNDTDGDGLCDSQDPCPLDPSNDTDGDGACGNSDNCPSVPNTDQQDTNGDGKGDACVPLTDGLAIIELITWDGPAPKEQALNQCEQLIDLDALAEDREQDCRAKCNALLNNSKNHAVSGGELLTDFCAAVFYQLDRDLACVP